MRIVPKAIRRMAATYEPEPIHGRAAACPPGPHELVALPRLPPRPRGDRLPHRRELPPPVRPPRVPRRTVLRLRACVRPRLPPPRLPGRRLPREPGGPLRGDRLRDSRPRPVPRPLRPLQVEAAGAVRHPPPPPRPPVRPPP